MASNFPLSDLLDHPAWSEEVLVRVERVASKYRGKFLQHASAAEEGFTQHAQEYLIAREILRRIVFDLYGAAEMPPPSSLKSLLE
jgi:hypothetical protein